MTSQDHDREFVKAAVSLWLEEYYGERCPDFEPGCIVCRKWKAFDEFFGEVDVPVPQVLTIEGRCVMAPDSCQVVFCECNWTPCRCCCHFTGGQWTVAFGPHEAKVDVDKEPNPFTPPQYDREWITAKWWLFDKKPIGVRSRPRTVKRHLPRARRRFHWSAIRRAISQMRARMVCE